jgi:hypothetical protein
VRVRVLCCTAATVEHAHVYYPTRLLQLLSVSNALLLNAAVLLLCCCCCATTQGERKLRDLCNNLTKALGAVPVKALEETAVLEFAEQHHDFLCRFKLLLSDPANSQPGQVTHHCCNYCNCHCYNLCCVRVLRVL